MIRPPKFNAEIVLSEGSESYTVVPIGIGELHSAGPVQMAARRRGFERCLDACDRFTHDLNRYEACRDFCDCYFHTRNGFDRCWNEWVGRVG